MLEENILIPRPNRIKSRIIIIVKLFLSVILSLLWFILVQAEYEMITKPELQNDFPIIKGVYAVYFTGFILLMMALGIFFLLYSIKNQSLKHKAKIS